MSSHDSTHPASPPRIAVPVWLSLCVALGAIQRQESRGAHFRTDYNTRDDANWLKHTLAYYQPGKATPRLDFKPVTLGPFELQERKY